MSEKVMKENVMSENVTSGSSGTETSCHCNKDGWVRKKLGEVCEIVGGSTPKTKVEEYWGGDNYWVTPAEIRGDKWISSTERTITEEGVQNSHLQLLPSGTVLLSSRAPIGKVAITTVPMYCNQGFKNLICSDSILNEFAYYFLKYNTDFLQSLGVGATFKEISKSIVQNIKIWLPSISEQQHIVSELECLNGIIEKQKEQLKQLDELAQSIFYDMFGDPVENEKGWVVKLIKELGSVVTGNTPSRKEHEYYSSNYLEWIKTDNIIKGKLYPSNAKEYLSEKGAIKGRIVPAKTVLVTCIAGSIKSIGTACLTNREVSFNQQINAIKPFSIINPFFLYYLISIQSNFIQSFATTGMKHIITKGVFENIPMILPPLPLQQSFAQKIEAIERQKELIKQSIEETETLFNSRMDYYFG